MILQRYTPFPFPFNTSGKQNYMISKHCQNCLVLRNLQNLLHPVNPYTFACAAFAYISLQLHQGLLPWCRKQERLQGPQPFWKAAGKDAFLRLACLEQWDCCQFWQHSDPYLCLKSTAFFLLSTSRCTRFYHIWLWIKKFYYRSFDLIQLGVIAALKACFTDG